MSLKVNLAHHWIVSMRGGEKVLAQFCKLFPEASINTLVADPAKWDDWVARHQILTSPLQRIPGAARLYKQMLPLFPAAIRRMRAPADTELLLSSDAAMIKGLSLPPNAAHVCYCHSPPRYLWDQQETYMQQTSGLGGIGRAVFRRVTPSIQRFDRQAAEGVDHFIANSDFVAQRIERIYGREAVVIHPPVAIDDFHWQQPREDFYLVVSALVPYKRVDLAVEAFSRMNRRLVVIGEGSERKRIEKLAGNSVEILGSQPFPVLQDHFQRCRGFVFPGVEDFGITPLEAMASGAPVVAYAEGGALETVVENETGVFFHQQSSEALCEAVEQLESAAIEANACRARAEQFSPAAFREKIWQQLCGWYPQLANTIESHPFVAGDKQCSP